MLLPLHTKFQTQPVLAFHQRRLDRSQRVSLQVEETLQIPNLMSNAKKLTSAFELLIVSGPSKCNLVKRVPRAATDGRGCSSVHAAFLICSNKTEILSHRACSPVSGFAGDVLARFKLVWRTEVEGGHSLRFLEGSAGVGGNLCSGCAV